MNEPVDDRDECERLLAGLRPRAAGISRDHLMFLAGRLAGLRERRKPSAALRERREASRWRWPLITAASWLITACVLSTWMLQPAGQFPEPIALQQQSARPGQLAAEQTGPDVAPDPIDTDSDAPDLPERSTAPRSGDSERGASFAMSPDTLVENLLNKRLGAFGIRRSSDVPANPFSVAPASHGSPEAPATYARLMSLYRSNEFADVTNGDRL